MTGPNDHEQAVVDISVVVITVVVIDGRDVEQVLTLVATHEGFITVEAEPRTSSFHHLLGG